MLIMSRRSHLLPVFMIILLIMLAYANSLTDAFVSDDITGIVDNVKNGTLASGILFPLHPLRVLLYVVTAGLFGLNPLWFRLSNILFHIGNTCLFYLLINRVKGKSAAFISALLFAVHPMVVESVTWISAGMQPQAVFFFFLSLVFYSDVTEKPSRLVLSCAAYLLAIASNEKAVVLFPAFLLWEFAFGNVRRNWQRLIPFIGMGVIGSLAALGYVSYRIGYLKKAYFFSAGFYNPLLQIPIALTSYLRLLVWPDALSFYQSELTYTKTAFIIRACICILFFLSVVWAARKNRYLLFWISVSLISLVPTLTPLKIAWVFAERYAYLLTAGFCACLGILFRNIWVKPKFTAPVYVVLAVIISGLTVRTVIRNSDWKNEDTLWLATARTAPSDPKTHNNLGDMYARHQEYPKSEAEFRKAIALQPDYADAYHNLANTLMRMNETGRAEENYRRAAAINPNLWQSWKALAVLSINNGRYDEAEQYVKKALAVETADADLYALSGLISYAEKDYAVARTFFTRALSMDPGNDYATLGMKKLNEK